MDEQGIGSSDTSSSVNSSGTRVLTQQSVKPMSLGEKGSSIDEASVDPSPADMSRDSGINEPSSLTGDNPVPATNQTNGLQKNMINKAWSRHDSLDGDLMEGTRLLPAPGPPKQPKVILNLIQSTNNIFDMNSEH